MIFNLATLMILIMNNKWLFFSIVGLLFVGFGLSLLGEAIIKKFNNMDHWVLWGTIALMVVNTGLCFVGQAIIEKIKGNPKN